MAGWVWRLPQPWRPWRNSGFFLVFCAVGVGLTRPNPTRNWSAKAQWEDAQHRTQQHDLHASPRTQQRPAATTPHTTTTPQRRRSTHMTPHPAPAWTANVDGAASVCVFVFLFFFFYFAVWHPFSMSFFFVFLFDTFFLFLTPIFILFFYLTLRFFFCPVLF